MSRWNLNSLLVIWFLFTIKVSSDCKMLLLLCWTCQLSFLVFILVLILYLLKQFCFLNEFYQFSHLIASSPDCNTFISPKISYLLHGRCVICQPAKTSHLLPRYSYHHRSSPPSHRPSFFFLRSVLPNPSSHFLQGISIGLFPLGFHCRYFFFSLEPFIVISLSSLMSLKRGFTASYVLMFSFCLAK